MSDQGPNSDPTTSPHTLPINTPTNTFPTNTLPTSTAPTYTLQAVSEAANNAADGIKALLGLGERDDDLLNLMVNATIGMLTGHARTMDEVLQTSYDPETARQLPNWWSSWS